MTPDATTHPTPTPVGGTLGSRNLWQSFGLGLAVIAVVGIVVRVAYIQIVGPHTRVYTDSSWYYLLAKDVRHGLGYIDIGRQFGFGGPPTRRPTAFLPPGYPSFLVVVQTLFGEAVHTARLSGVATGAATVAL